MSFLLQRLGVTLPIVQAPMAGTSTPAMAAAVSNAGGLGSLAVGAVDATGAQRMIEQVRELTRQPFNVNVFAHRPARADAAHERAWLNALRPIFERYGAEPPPSITEIYTSFVADEALLQVLLATKPAVVSFHFGLPSAAIVDQLKTAGVVLFSTATNLDEAMQAAGVGVDAIVAQVYEAGGHRGIAQLGCLRHRDDLAHLGSAGAPLARFMPAADLVRMLAGELKAAGRKWL